MAFCTPGRLKSTIGKVIFLDVMPIRIFVSKFGCFSDRGILIPIKILEQFQGHFFLLFEKLMFIRRRERHHQISLWKKAVDPRIFQDI